MERLGQNKPIFIALSCLSIGCLVGSFAYPLQQVEVWRQVDVGAFGIEYERNFIVTESDLNYPYGFDQTRAVKVAQIYRSYKLEKLFLLAMSFISAIGAMRLGDETCTNDELNAETQAIVKASKRQLLLEKIKHRFAMASKAQRLQFVAEMRELIESFSTVESEIIEADEVNAIDQDETDDVADTEDELIEKLIIDESAFRLQFPEVMDSEYWRLMTTDVSNGVAKDKIVRTVLGCDESSARIGEMYFDYLISKFGANR